MDTRKNRQANPDNRSNQERPPLPPLQDPGAGKPAEKDAENPTQDPKKDPETAEKGAKKDAETPPEAPKNQESAPLPEQKTTPPANPDNIKNPFKPTLPRDMQSGRDAKLKKEKEELQRKRKAGLICPNVACSSQRLSVVQTYDTQSGRRRARKCLKCGTLVTTEEKPIETAKG